MEKLVQQNQQINQKQSRSLNSKAHHSKKDRPAARLSTPRRSCEKQAFGAARPQACKPGVNPCKSPCVHQSKKIRCTLLEPSSIPRFPKLPSLLNRCLQRPANNLKPHMSHISYICTCTVQYAKTYNLSFHAFTPTYLTKHLFFEICRSIIKTRTSEMHFKSKKLENFQKNKAMSSKATSGTFTPLASFISLALDAISRR